MTENVFILVIDGARYTETFGDPLHQYVPRIWGQLKPLGAVYTRFYNDGLTETCPGHSAIMTGAWQDISNDGLQRPLTPTLFEYFRKELGTSPEQNFVILGKDKLNILAYGDATAGYGAAYGASVQTSALPYSDTATWGNIQSVLNAHHPRLAVANFAQVDNKGHAGVMADYLSAIRQADSLAAELWNFLQADPAYHNTTTLFVVNDHGRHTADFTSHGDTCEGCRHILLLILGPDTPAGVEDSVYRRQIDMAPTVGQLLGFAASYSTGSAITTGVFSPIEALRTPAPASFGLDRASLSSGPVVRVPFSVASAGFVTLRVFDACGKAAATLVQSSLGPGDYAPVWDAGHAAGGMYYFRLQSGAYGETRKWLRIK